MNETTRIAVTVDKQMADQFKVDLKTLGLPAQTLSNLVNEWMGAFAPVLRQMADKKLKGEQLSFEEIMGTVVSSLGEGMKP